MPRRVLVTLLALLLQIGMLPIEAARGGERWGGESWNRSMAQTCRTAQRSGSCCCCDDGGAEMTRSTPAASQASCCSSGKEQATLDRPEAPHKGSPRKGRPCPCNLRRELPPAPPLPAPNGEGSLSIGRALDLGAARPAPCPPLLDLPAAPWAERVESDPAVARNGPPLFRLFAVDRR